MQNGGLRFASVVTEALKPKLLSLHLHSSGSQCGFVLRHAAVGILAPYMVFYTGGW